VVQDRHRINTVKLLTISKSSKPLGHRGLTGGWSGTLTQTYMKFLLYLFSINKTNFNWLYSNKR